MLCSKSDYKNRILTGLSIIGEMPFQTSLLVQLRKLGPLKTDWTSERPPMLWQVKWNSFLVADDANMQRHLCETESGN